MEIDLTLDDDDDVIIKQEIEKSMHALPQAAKPEEMDVDTLRDEIKATELEEQMIKVGQNKLALERELKKKQRQRGSMARPLKIEAED